MSNKQDEKQRKKFGKKLFLYSVTSALFSFVLDMTSSQILYSFQRSITDLGIDPVDNILNNLMTGVFFISIIIGLIGISFWTEGKGYRNKSRHQWPMWKSISDPTNPASPNNPANPNYIFRRR